MSKVHSRKMIKATVNSTFNLFVKPNQPGNRSSYRKVNKMQKFYVSSIKLSYFSSVERRKIFKARNKKWIP